mmetsp:Transcript_32134/g.49139  ORF Transcript_32134/g.49139 Transcript_32134/m.49139 type:complete len:256 (-) Transcript_32134:894-1661(-)
MALRYNTSLEHARLPRHHRAEVHDRVLVLADHWADHTRPEVGLLGGGNSFSFVHHLHIRSHLVFLNNKIAILLVDDVRLLRALREDTLWDLLRQGAEITPEIRVLCHRASSVVRARRNNVGFVPALGEHPLTNAVCIAEALRTTGLNHNENSSVLDAVPESLEDHEPLLLILDFLEDVAEYDHVELASLTTVARDHGERVCPQDVAFRVEILSQILAELPHVGVGLDGSHSHYVVAEAVHSCPETRAEAGSVVEH